VSVCQFSAVDTLHPIEFDEQENAFSRNWTFYLDDNGLVYLEIGMFESTPRRMEALEDFDIVSISAGYGHALFLTREGHVLAMYNSLLLLPCSLLKRL